MGWIVRGAAGPEKHHLVCFGFGRRNILWISRALRPGASYAIVPLKFGAPATRGAPPAQGGLMSIFSRLSGRRVGADRFGNVYFESRGKVPVYNRTRRWVVYAKAADPTTVPPEWHAWLHHTVDQPLPEKPLYPWQEPHRPNQTGTPSAYRPAGHQLNGGRRQPAGADYEAWTPGQ